MKNDRATALVCKDNQILMIHRLKAGREYYVLPGGHVEDGETVETAVIRELNEETSLEAKLGNKLSSFVDEYNRIHHIYSCEYISGIPKLAPNSPEASDGPRNLYTPMWVDIGKIVDLKMWPNENKAFYLEIFMRSHKLRQRKLILFLRPVRSSFRR